MNLMVNELLKDEDTDKLYRILWVDEENIMAYLIDIYDVKAFPFIRPIRELKDDIVQDELTKIKSDPYLSYVYQSE